MRFSETARNHQFRFNIAAKGSLPSTVQSRPLVLMCTAKKQQLLKNVSVHQPTPFAEAPTNRRNINEQKLKRRR